MKSLLRFTAIIALFFAQVIIFTGCNGKKSSDLRIIVTTDVHGNIFSHNMENGNIMDASMSKVSAYTLLPVTGSMILLDNGDNLQGTPSVYYYNFEDTVSVHIWPRVLNYIGYDAVTTGNHDIEAGHNVYDRVRAEYNFPMLAANAVSEISGKPYFDPYTIIRRDGLKVAVIGLITPGVPGWLPEVLYKDIRFEDMVESARKWMPEVLKQKPDLVVGLFHAGWDEEYGPGTAGSYLNENASLAVARQVPGFDLIFIGHDHDIKTESVINSDGDTVMVLDGGSHAAYISVADIHFEGKGGNRKYKVNGYIVKTDTVAIDTIFDRHFEQDYRKVMDYENREIGNIISSISSRDSYFGDSPFIDLIQTVQLEVSGADISIAAPLSFDVNINSGTLQVRDMFDLYRYENMLYTIELTGNEIDSYLEYSYDLWTEQMNSSRDLMLKYESFGDRPRLMNRYYNYDSAEGIDYTVDLSKAAGDKVTILRMSNGDSFDTQKRYRVALNSYRGSGGGGHLKNGAGLTQEEINNRLIESTDKDLRYYMIRWIEKHTDFDIEANNNWKFIPIEWAESARKREEAKMFPNRY